jgi:hypothetical protein
VTEYVDLLFSFGLLQVITKPTRCTQNSATLIDHVITNAVGPYIESIIITSLISDHFPILHHCNTSKKISKPTIIKTRNFSDENIGRFNQALQRLDWSAVTECNDTQISYNYFSDSFLSLYDIYFPLIEKKLNPNFSKIEPWFTQGLLISRKTKLKLSKTASHIPTDENISSFKIYRNLYNRTVRAGKKLFYQKELELNQSNLKRTWELIRSAANMPLVKKDGISQVSVDGELLSDPIQIATKFNEFFTSMPAKIVSEIISPPPAPPEPENIDLENNRPVFCFTNSPVTQTEILDSINQLQPKKSSDLNGISMFFLKKVMNSILKPFHHIVLSSLSTGVVPTQLKIAKVIPIFKSGDQSALDNYRPISLLSNFSKILEKVVGNRLTSYLENNELLSPSQFGFRKGRSTMHPLVHFMNTVSTALNKKHHSIAIFCDLRKAFDTVDHEILLKKLKKMGIGGVELEWFRNYLCDRKQFVFIEGNCSPLLSILLGVPQGSILGPLLFLIYINDLHLASELLSSLFADDTMLLKSGPNIEELANLVNTEFQKVVQYFRANKLALHPNKTQFLLFTHSPAAKENPPEIYINNNDVGMQDPSKLIPIPNINVKSPVPAVKFLGIFIDPALNFKYHIEKMTRKLATALFFMRNAKNFLSMEAMRSLYYSIFHSVIVYGIHVWSSTANSNLQGIILKQKAAVRIVCGARYNDHTEPLFKFQKILPIECLMDFFALQFMQHYQQGFLPSIFVDTWPPASLRRDEEFHMNLRNNDDLAVPFARLNLTERQPLTHFPKVWLNFPNEDIKFIRNKLEFKKKLKDHFLSQLKDLVICDRLFCPQCHPPDRL